MVRSPSPTSRFRLASGRMERLYQKQRALRCRRAARGRCSTHRTVCLLVAMARTRCEASEQNLKIVKTKRIFGRSVFADQEPYCQPALEEFLGETNDSERRERTAYRRSQNHKRVQEPAVV